MIIDTETKKVYECPADGSVYRLPVTDNVDLNRSMVTVAELMVEKERNARRNKEMLMHMMKMIWKYTSSMRLFFPNL